MRTVFKTETIVSKRALHTHIPFGFEIKEGGEKLSVAYSYAPKRYSGADAENLAYEAFLRAYPSDEKIEKAAVLGTLPLNNHITLSLEKDGAVVGTAHRHSPDNLFEITGEYASPGFFPTPVTPGKYTIVLSVHAILDEEVSVRMEAKVE